MPKTSESATRCLIIFAPPWRLIYWPSSTPGMVFMKTQMVPRKRRSTRMLNWFTILYSMRRFCAKKISFCWVEVWAQALPPTSLHLRAQAALFSCRPILRSSQSRLTRSAGWASWYKTSLTTYQRWSMLCAQLSLFMARRTPWFLWNRLRRWMTSAAGPPSCWHRPIWLIMNLNSTKTW